MYLVTKLILFTLLFSVPSGLLVGLAAKQQKLAGLLRFARPDRSMIPGALGIVVTGLMLSAGGKQFPAVSPLQTTLLVAFFIEAGLVAYATYRFAVGRAQR